MKLDYLVVNQDKFQTITKISICTKISTIIFNILSDNAKIKIIYFQGFTPLKFTAIFVYPKALIRTFHTSFLTTQ